MEQMDCASTRYRELAIFAKRHYVRRTKHSRHTQTELLSRIVSLNRDTQFGRQHGFAHIHSIADYQQNVPIRPYLELEPWIARSAAGEPAVLTVQPPLLFHRTSTTTGTGKKLPVTRRGIALMFANSPARQATLLEAHPEICVAPDAALSLTANPIVQPHPQNGIPCCFYSETDWPSLGFSRHSGGPGAGAAWTTIPDGEPDPHYYRLRMCLESPLRAILTWFPASVLWLAQNISEHRESLIRDLHDGTSAGRQLCRPNTSRARELEQLFVRSAPTTLRDLWPQLTVVECWRTATSQFYLQQLRSCVGVDVEIFPAGYGSTETPIAFTFEPSIDATLLDVTCAVFEFLPVSDREATPLLHHELESGREYVLVVTTMNGLYRYALGDVVRVHDFVNDVPLLEFCYRDGVACSLVAEKLNESQVVDAIRAAIDASAEPIVEASLCPWYEGTPHYVLLLDANHIVTRHESLERAKALDAALARNVNYAFHRSMGLIGPPSIETLACGTFAEWRREQRDTGNGSVPQQKHRIVTSRAERERLLNISRRLRGSSS